MSSRQPSRLAKVYAVIRVLALTGVLVYLAWLVISGWPSVRAVTVRWDAASLVLSLVSAVAAYQALFVGWLVLLARTGLFERRHLLRYGRIWWISYLYRYVPGKVLLLVERARLGTSVGVPPAAGAAFTVIETLLAIVAAAWVSLLAGTFYLGDGPWLPIAIAALSVVILVLLPVIYPRFVRLGPIRRRFPELSTVALRPTDLLLAVVPFVLHYLLLGASLYLWGRGLDAFSSISLPGLCGIYALSHVIGLITLIAPGGLGVREGALAIQLNRVLPAGVAGVLALGSRLWFTLVEMLSLALVLLVSPRLQSTAAPTPDETAPSEGAP